MSDATERPADELSLAEELARLLAMEGFEGGMDVLPEDKLYELALKIEEDGGKGVGWAELIPELGRRLTTKQFQSAAIFALIQYIRAVLAEEQEKRRLRRCN